MKESQPNNPLHGITLETIVTQLADRYGWEELGERILCRYITRPALSDERVWAPARTCGDLAGFKLLTGLGGHSAQLAVERGRPWLGAQGSIWSLVRKLRPSMGTVSA